VLMATLLQWITRCAR